MMIVRKGSKIVGHVVANGNGAWNATAVKWGTDETKWLGVIVGLDEAVDAVKKARV